MIDSLLNKIQKAATDDRLTLSAIGLLVKLNVLSLSTIEDDRTDSINCSGVRCLTLDECLQSVFESGFSDYGKTFDREFESLIAELERCEYLTKFPIVLPGQGVSHSYRFVEQTQ